MQSGRGDRSTRPITSFDQHVLSEGVALSDPYASDKDAKLNMPGALSNLTQPNRRYNIEQKFRI